MLPVVFNQTDAQMPVLPGQDNFTDAFLANAFGDFQSGYRYLRPKKINFQVDGGGASIQLENNKVVGVLLGVAPHNFCTWYERKYQVGMEPTAPDLVWVQTTPDTFPDALPEQYRKKVNVGGNERWDFRIARRTVWALVTQDGNGQYMLDLDNPVIFDMTSASMYGKSDDASGTYKWAGMKQFCAKYSSAGHSCSPLMFYTQIMLDINSPVQGVVVFRPVLNNNGVPAFLDNDTYAMVVEKAQSAVVADMLKVTEILTYGQNKVPQTPPVQAATAPAQPEPVRPEPQPEPAPVQPSENGGLLEQAQALLSKPAQPAPEPVAHEPHVHAPSPTQKASAAATAGIASIMGSLGDL